MKLLVRTIALAGAAAFAAPAPAQSLWLVNVFRQGTPEARLDNLASSSTSKSLPGAQPPWGSGLPVSPVGLGPGAPTYGNLPYLDPVDYCTARANAIGCVPKIAWSGRPSASLGSGFTISCQNVRNLRVGVLVFGLGGPDVRPFHGATLCVRPPLLRTKLYDSGGSGTGDDCTGTLSLDFNAFIAGQPSSSLLRMPGIVIHAQWWMRDSSASASHNTSLSDAMRFVVGF
jgi:hypothetical protein